LLGITTFAKDEADASVAIQEAVICFFIAAEKFGCGIEKELNNAIKNWVGGNDGGVTAVCKTVT